MASINANFHYALDIGKTLNYKKVTNATQLLSSYYKSKRRGKNLHHGLPFALSIEPTTACNLRCPQCPSGLRSFSRPTGNLKPETLGKVIDQLHQSLGYINFYFQGEPLIHPHFTEMVKMASDKDIFTATSSNGHFFTEKNCEALINSGLNRIIVSIDGVTQETYGKYRLEGQLDKVLQGTKNLQKVKKEMGKHNPHLIWQFIVFQHNEHELEAIKKLAKQYGVDQLAIKTAQIYDFENAEQWLPKNKKLSRYIKEQGVTKIKGKLLNHCWRMWHSCVITWDGRVVPCCFDKDARYEMGNIQHQDFLDIWNGDKYKAFRNLLLKSRNNIDICRNCTEGTQVWN